MTADRFLSRWMRRKAAARQTEVAPPVPPAPMKASEAPPPAVPATPAESAAALSHAPQSPQAELPSLDSLQGLVSEYRGFMHADVDPNMQRAALKKLFSDPHFNVMDGLDVYIDDYGIPDPIPADMLASLHQAKGLLFNEPEVEPVQVPDPDQVAQPTAAEVVDEGGEPSVPPVQIESGAVAVELKEVTEDSTVLRNELPSEGGKKGRIT